MEMLPKIPLRILDLSKVDKISPFNENVNCRMLASNLNNLRQIKDALTQPMRKNDNIIEYVPTQYLASYALSIGFDGIGYSSILASGSDTEAFNIASFKGFEEAFICKSISMHKIKDVSTVDESTEIILWVYYQLQLLNPTDFQSKLIFDQASFLDEGCNSTQVFHYLIQWRAYKVNTGWLS